MWVRAGAGGDNCIRLHAVNDAKVDEVTDGRFSLMPSHVHWTRQHQLLNNCKQLAVKDYF